jgi:hypothetical protein
LEAGGDIAAGRKPEISYKAVAQKLFAEGLPAGTLLESGI